MKPVIVQRLGPRDPDSGGLVHYEVGPLLDAYVACQPEVRRPEGYMRTHAAVTCPECIAWADTIKGDVEAHMKERAANIKKFRDRATVMAVRAKNDWNRRAY